MKLSVKKRAAEVELVIFDVDGVLTGGEIIHGPDGEWKIFDVQDGLGFALARRYGLRTALLTARRSAAARRRATELKVNAMQEGASDKGVGLIEIAQKLGVDPRKVCYVGDDIADLPAMRKAGLAVAVANAAPEVKKRADWITVRRGGKGAAREVIEGILKAKGLWSTAVKKAEEGGT